MAEIKAARKYKVSDKYLLRTPLLSFHVLDEILNNNDLDNILSKYYSSSLVSEALFLASPELHRIMAPWIGDNETKLKNPLKFKLSLLKYLIRMSSRCTPFGLFAGIASGEFNTETNIRISPRNDHKLHIRPDMQYLCTIAGALAGDPDIRNSIKIFPNTSLMMVGDEYRYVEYFTDVEGVRRYHLQKTPVTQELSKVLDKADKGAGIEELTNLIAQNGISAEEADKYIHVLLDNQVMISSLEPVVSGTPYLHDLLDQLGSMKDRNALIDQLARLDTLIEHHANARHGERIGCLYSILELARKSGFNFREGSLVQADLHMSCETNVLSATIKDDMEEVLPVLMKLTRAPRNNLLDRFREAFVRRYEMQEIPLSIALDAEAGPGYLPGDRDANASSILEGLILTQEVENTHEYTWEQNDRLLYGKLQHVLMSGERTIEITDKDLERLPAAPENFPMSFSVLAKVLGPWEKDEGRNVIQLESVGGNSAANLCGRFCYLDDRLEATVREITKLEQEIMGDVVLAEIVHLPQQRTGNVLMRPVLRDHEIPYLARAGTIQEKSIPLSDLMVSVRQNRIVLRSKKLNKYILPRLSNAHNYSLGSLPVYRFLCDLQSQGLRTNINLSWGPLENDTIFLPKVTYRNFILHPARWNLPRVAFNGFLKASKPEEMMRSIQKIKLEYKLPEQVTLPSWDNELWIDFNSIHCLHLLQNEIKGHEKVVMNEFLYQGDTSIVKGGDGTYANECIFLIHQNPQFKH